MADIINSGKRRFRVPKGFRVIVTPDDGATVTLSDPGNNDDIAGPWTVSGAAATFGPFASAGDMDVSVEGGSAAIEVTSSSGGGGGGAVDSVFGRTGIVSAQANDYTFAQIGSKPTTLAGYGITDAAASSHSHSNATGASAGFMSGADKTKLDTVTAGATPNSPDATLLSRANHTGTQPFSTLSDGTEAVQDIVGAMIVGAGGTYDDPTGSISLPAGGGGTPTNLSSSADATTVTVNSDTGTDATIAAATGAAAGVMTAADKTKLDGVAAGATVNATDAQLRDRATHTGTQASSTISDFTEAVQDVVGALVSAAGGSYNDAGNSITFPSSSGAVTVEDVGTTTYTVVAGDLGKVKRFTNAGGCTVTVPASLGAGFNCSLLKASTAGTITVAAGASAAVNSSSGDLTLSDSRAFASLVPEAADTYVLVGGVGGYTEGVQDVVGAMVAAAGGSYDDNAGTITLPGGGGATNLSFTRDATTLTVASDTGTDAVLPAATTSLAGLQSAADKTKLDGIASGATANSADATLLSRANHTGTQTASTISDFTEASQDVVGAMIAAAGGSYDDGAGTITLPGGGSTSITVQDEGTPLTTDATALNFTGAGVTASGTGATKVIDVPGYTDEQAMDAVATAMVLPTGAYDDAGNAIRIPFVLPIACSDESTALTAGAGKIAFHMPVAMSLTAVMAGLTVVQTSGAILTVDINEGAGAGTSILSTALTVDNGEETSLTAATAAVISDSALAKGSRVTIDIDQVGDGTAKGLKVYLVGFITGF